VLVPCGVVVRSAKPCLNGEACWNGVRYEPPSQNEAVTLTGV